MTWVTRLDQDLSGWQVGGKAGHLARLGRLPGVRTPPGVAVDARALEAFVQHSFTTTEWEGLLADYRAGRRGPLFAELAHAPLPAPLLDELIAALPSGPLLIVRSSGVQEDGSSTSLAGHYESLLTRPQPDAVTFAVKACWLVSLRVLLDHLAPDASAASALRSMALVVQPVVAASRSGVLFTQAPTHPGLGMVVAGWGSCHAVVEGRTATDQWLLRGPRVHEETLRFKFEMSLPDAAEYLPGEPVQAPCGPTSIHQLLSRHLYLARVPVGLDAAAALEPGHLERLTHVAARLKAELGRGIDMEWSFVEDDLVVLQARPITTRSRRTAAPASPSSYRIASSGIARGRIRIITSPRQLDKVGQGDILAVVATDPDYMPMLYRAGAVLSEEGSPLAHTAIVARELKIPCLLGVPLNTLTDGELVTVDGRRGLILRRPPVDAPAPAVVTLDRTLLFDIDHLRWMQGQANAALSFSALLAGWDPSRGSLAARVAELQQRYQIGHIGIVLDISDLDAVRAEQVPELRSLAASVGAI